VPWAMWPSAYSRGWHADIMTAILFLKHMRTLPSRPPVIVVSGSPLAVAKEDAAMGDAAGGGRGPRALGRAQLTLGCRMILRAVRLHADGAHAGPRTVSPRRVGLRGEGPRLADTRVQGRRARAPSQPQRPRPHPPLSPDRGGGVKLRARALVLDGEVAIFDQQLRSRFDWLREPHPDVVATPPMFMVLDLLHQDGRELAGRPLRERCARMEDGVADNDLVLPVRRLALNGFEASRGRGAGPASAQ